MPNTLVGGGGGGSRRPAGGSPLQGLLRVLQPIVRVIIQPVIRVIQQAVQQAVQTRAGQGGGSPQGGGQTQGGGGQQQGGGTAPRNQTAIPDKFEVGAQEYVLDEFLESDWDSMYDSPNYNRHSQTRPNLSTAFDFWSRRGSYTWQEIMNSIEPFLPSGITVDLFNAGGSTEQPGTMAQLLVNHVFTDDDIPRIDLSGLSFLAQYYENEEEEHGIRDFPYPPLPLFVETEGGFLLLPFRGPARPDELENATQETTPEEEMAASVATSIIFGPVAGAVLDALLTTRDAIEAGQSGDEEGVQRTLAFGALGFLPDLIGDAVHTIASSPLGRKAIDAIDNWWFTNQVARAITHHNLPLAEAFTFAESRIGGITRREVGYTFTTSEQLISGNIGPLTDITKDEGATVTLQFQTGGSSIHSHPRGGAHSLTDVAIAIKRDQNTMIVTGTSLHGERWLYTIHRPAGGWGLTWGPTGDIWIAGNNVVGPFAQTWQSYRAAATDAIDNFHQNVRSPQWRADWYAYATRNTIEQLIADYGWKVDYEVVPLNAAAQNSTRYAEIFGQP